jgi:hypothetical protein
VIYGFVSDSARPDDLGTLNPLVKETAEQEKWIEGAEETKQHIRCL